MVRTPNRDGHAVSPRRWRVAAVVGFLGLLATGCFYHFNVPFDAGPLTRTTTTETLRIGPFNLAAINTPGWEVLQTPVVPRPAGNVAIKGMDFTVVDGAGNEIGLDRVHLHHIVMLDQSRPDPVCPAQRARFGGTGGERTKLNLMGSYAYMVEASDVWRANFHIHTTTSTPVPEAYIQYKVTYEEVTDPADFRSVTPYFLDVTGCSSASIYDVPGGGGPGSTHVASKTFTIPQDGVAAFTGGHIHAGSSTAKLTRDITGEDYCTATASYGPGGHPNHPNTGQLRSISSCLQHSEIDAGEQFTLTAAYDNEYFVAKAMGIMLMYVWHP